MCENENFYLTAYNALVLLPFQSVQTLSSRYLKMFLLHQSHELFNIKSPTCIIFKVRVVIMAVKTGNHLR